MDKYLISWTIFSVPTLLYIAISRAYYKNMANTYKEMSDFWRESSDRFLNHLIKEDMEKQRKE